ncbi:MULTISPECIES: GatB/YqeY domain-containing protein [Olivibacter]|uniref:GatB/YqeY domain-containing protein n=1 Tax=Olivibacter oleidegradans TaxID=760123 RepID=A0ABV6HQ25_9SPHI|nr:MULTISPECIES: GatB/YqeY domain-containing protein [Olivibacter]MDX3915089.1 GatB/YqeY domain-containing protein [Pseudosphingobacterium sp.]QEL03692.1 GatB/YqeY domain-containing protein [Olivibacter sp. LS-1]
MALENTINQDIKAAMLAKDEARLRGLRAIKSALLLAKTEKGATETLTEETEVKVLQKLVKQRKESAEIYLQQNRQDLYQIEKEEQDVIEEYLPKQLSREEIVAEVQRVIQEVGATSVKDMGKVMGLINQRLAGKADGKTIAEVVKEQLSAL